MLLIAGVVAVLIAVVLIPRVRSPGGLNSTAIGWMSDQWLAEQRMSHSA
jgi:hypothetical protein